MKWHIIGSEGYIGTRLLNRLEGIEHNKYALAPNNDEIKIDFENVDNMDLSRIRQGDYVVLLAAISSPDICNNRYDYAYSINVTGTSQFIDRCIDIGANLLFFSSDAVNGKTERIHCELSDVVPFGKYANMKYEIEQRYKDCEQFKACRLSYVFSRNDKFMKYLTSCAELGQPADVYDSFRRNVIYIEDVVKTVIQIGKKYKEIDPGLINVSGIQCLSRKDMAQFYQEVVSPSFVFTTSVPPKEFFDARPDIINTSSLYLEDILGRKPTLIKDAMRIEF